MGGKGVCFGLCYALVATTSSKGPVVRDFDQEQPLLRQISAAKTETGVCLSARSKPVIHTVASILCKHLHKPKLTPNKKKHSSHEGVQAGRHGGGKILPVVGKCFANSPASYRSLSGPSGPKCSGTVPEMSPKTRGVRRSVARGVSGILRAPGSGVSKKCPESVPGVSKRCPG